MRPPVAFGLPAVAVGAGADEVHGAGTRNGSPAPRVSLTMAVMELAVREGATTFENFFHQNHQTLLRVLYLASGDPHEAEDLVQEAFVRVYERWDRVRETENPAGYLYRTALNVHRSRGRRMALAARKALRLAPRREDVPDPASAATDRDAIRRALSALPLGQREAVVLVEWLGMTDEEAGAILGVAPGTLRVRISRARPKLQAMLRGDTDD